MALANNLSNMTTETTSEGICLAVLTKAIDALANVINPSPQIDLTLCREAHDQLKSAHDTILAYDKGLCAVEIAPDGEDYNFVLQSLGV